MGLRLTVFALAENVFTVGFVLDVLGGDFVRVDELMQRAGGAGRFVAVVVVRAAVLLLSRHLIECLL